MNDETLKRTQDEIVARIQHYQSDEGKPEDFWGHKRDVLLDYLDYEHVKPYLKDGIAAEQWEEVRPGPLKETAIGYYAFALGKIEGHRGLSAERSVDKLETYAWLMGRDDVVRVMQKAPYAMYGAPKVKVFADLLVLPWPGDKAFTRMSVGKPCEPDCVEGCYA